MLNCLTYIAFVYWAVATVHTVLPVDVAVCGAGAVRGGLGALFKHAFGGDLDVDVAVWQGFPCNSGLLTKLAFILRRPAATVRHIMHGGGQDEPFVPILFVVPLMFAAVVLLRRLGLRIMSFTAARTMLKFGVAIGCRSVILMHSLTYPTKESVYFKRYSKVEFCIIAWTAYIIELPVWHEALVSGGTAVTILMLCGLFPHHMLPEVNPINVATQGVAAAALGVAHAYYQQRRRITERAALATRSAAKAAAMEAAAAEEQQQQLLKEAAGHGGASTSSSAVAAAGAEISKTAADAVTTAVPTPATSGAATVSPAAAAAGAAGSLAALRRIHAMAGRSYVSPARPCRFSIKIQHAHLSDLPLEVMSVLNAEVLAGSGWQAVSAHAREGCVELVLDLRPLLPARPSYGNSGGAAADDRRAQSDQDRPHGAAGGGADADGDTDDDAAPPIQMDASALRELGRSVVSYLHRAGVIRPDREQSVVLQMNQDTIVVTWDPEAEVWAVADPAAAAAASPRLQYVLPRVATWPGVVSPLRLTALLVGPSAEEVLAGGGVVVRSATCSLPYSVLRVRPQAAPPPMAAAAAEPPPLLVELAVIGAPCSGLLQVEARSASGLLSEPLAVVVDHDATVVSGLAAVAAAMDDDSADAFLRDYGSWLDLALARTLAARNVYDITDTGGRVARKGSAAAAAAGADGCAALLDSIVGPAADMSYGDTLCFDPHDGFRDQAGTGRIGGGAAAPPAMMLTVAADLLSLCCQGAGTRAAVAAVVDRLIACVIACDDSRTPAAVLTVLLDAVPVAPTGAGALHMAVAAGSRPTVEVLVRWQEQLYGGGGAAAANLWLSRASCGVTPLHVAAAMPDGGAMASWLLDSYETAADLWASAAAASDDGLTPAVLAAQLGGRWRLRVWHASGAVRAVRRALTSPAPLARAAELLFGFRDPPLERRFADESASRQIAVTTIALYAVVSALLPLLALTKAALYGSPETTLATLVFHLPHAAPLLAWVCQSRSRSESAPAATAAVRWISPPPPPTSSATHGPRTRPSAAQHIALGRGRASYWSIGGARGLQRALMVTHLSRAAVKAAVGLSLWRLTLPVVAEVFVERRGNIVMEVVVRPLLEQVGLPARLLMSLADAPATWLLYRGVERQHPGLVQRPLVRVMLYQAVLLATTAAVTAANRVRFLRAQKTRVGATWDLAAAAAAATGLSASSPSPSSQVGGADGGGGKAGRSSRPLLRVLSSSGGGGGGKGSELAAGAGAGDAASGLSRMGSMRGGDDQAAGGGGTAGGASSCHARCGWTWLRGR